MAKREKVQKTNAMRELDRADISYEVREFEETDVSRGVGMRIAEQLGEDPDSSLKTLVCVAPSGDHVVCCIPVACEVDLKKAAAAAGEKSLSLMPIKDLEAVTGYVRGGCTPIGMKKPFPTVFHETVVLFESICVSAGKIGHQVEVDPAVLMDFLGATAADLTTEEK